MKTTLAIVSVLALAPIAFANDNYKETREIRTAFTGSINVDASPVGGIVIHAWDQPDVLIRAEIDADSRATAAQVVITETAGVVRATGPLVSRNRTWAVGWDIFLPPAADLTLKVNVGGIVIQGVTGKIRCVTRVGGIVMTSVGGDVECTTTVGGIVIALAGDHWDGAGLNVRTNVGGIDISLPANYSAHFDLATEMGAIVTTLPLPVVKSGMAASVSADVGAGGATIQAATNVGGVTVK